MKILIKYDFKAQNHWDMWKLIKFMNALPVIFIIVSNT